MELSTCLCDDDAEWDKFVSRSPHGTVFALSDFLISTLFEYRRYWVKNAQGVPLAAAPIPIDENGLPLKHLVPFSMYQGVMLAPELLGTAAHRRIPECMAVVNKLIDSVVEQHSNFIWCLPVGFEDIRPFQWHNYHQPEMGAFSTDIRYTGRIDLSGTGSIDDFLSMIRSGRRWEYRKALKMGMSAESSTDIDLLIELYGLTFERQGRFVAVEQTKLLHSIASQALLKGYGEITVVRSAEGEPASATLFLRDRYRAYYLVGANSPEFRGTYSGILAFVEAVRRCQGKGDKEIDVCGMNSPNRSDFKTSFNAVLSPYFMVTLDKLE